MVGSSRVCVRADVSGGVGGEGGRIASSLFFEFRPHSNQYEKGGLTLTSLWPRFFSVVLISDLSGPHWTSLFELFFFFCLPKPRPA